MLDGLTMKPERLDPGSALSDDTRFRFSQQDSLVAGEYDGGPIHRGYLVGVLDRNTLEFRYVQLSHTGRLDSGRSRCEIFRERDGLRLVERYVWETRDGAGMNVFVQCADDTRQL